MNHIKNNIYYKTIRRWFKSRRKKQEVNRVVYFRRSLFYLRPIRLWLSKITVRYSDSPRGSSLRCRQSTGQRYHQTIKKNQQGLLCSQNPKGDTQWNQPVEGVLYSRCYQYNRKTVFPNKNQPQGISWPLKQQCPYGRELTRLLFYVFKNTLLTGQLPFRGVLASVVLEKNLSNIAISLTVKMNFTDLLALVVREPNPLNRLSSMSSSQQKITVNYPLWFVRNERVEILQNIQMKENKLNRPSGQENKSKKAWWPGFNWNDAWDSDWDPNEGGMHGRFSSVMAWDSSHWGDSENNNGEPKNKEKEICTIRNHWELSSELEKFLKVNIEQIPEKDSTEYSQRIFKIYQYLHTGSNNPPKILEGLAEKNILDWPWSIEALGNLVNYLSNLQTQSLHVDSHKPLARKKCRKFTRFSPYKRNSRDLGTGRGDRQLQLNQLLQSSSLLATDDRDLSGVGRINSEIDYGSRNVSKSNLTLDSRNKRNTASSI
ncbi:hypothetical protein [unidentified bacterial endosymbiont]|uniref:hypothetical protein n=1 Tax=unidentified bacterial endosymbiont TaxID=2355 RepID=UPI00209E3918|nr:hypothetical protein [unidentified bacterial endosymbiont]